MFIDHVIIEVEAGKGGSGCVSFRREKYVPRGGPDGGDGGNGGSIIIEADGRVATLIDLHYKKSYKAPAGGHGQGSSKSGKAGGEVVIPVPVGTVIKDNQSGAVLCELLEKGARFTAAAGGAGGKGNEKFKSARNRAPTKSTKGKPGEKSSLELTLKLIADVGLVGKPNSGKSTLLSVLSDAKPKTAPYPFTTRTPVLGIVKADRFQSFVMVDIPGLIEGAHKGRGMGREFLRHVERCRVLLFLVDVTDPDPLDSYETVRSEILRYDARLLEKPCLLAFTKCDLLGGGIDTILPDMPGKSLPISAVGRQGLDELVGALINALG